MNLSLNDQTIALDNTMVENDVTNIRNLESKIMASIENINDIKLILKFSNVFIKIFV